MREWKYWVLLDGELREELWHKVVVGDIIHMENNQFVAVSGGERGDRACCVCVCVCVCERERWESGSPGFYGMGNYVRNCGIRSWWEISFVWRTTSLWR